MADPHLADPHPIEISVETRTGNITASPSSANFVYPQIIEWRSKQADHFILVFTDGEVVDVDGQVRGSIRTELKKDLTEANAAALAAFDNLPVQLSSSIRIASVKINGVSIARAKARKPGIHHYQLALFVEGQVYADMNCNTINIHRAQP